MIVICIILFFRSAHTNWGFTYGSPQAFAAWAAPKLFINIQHCCVQMLVKSCKSFLWLIVAGAWNHEVPMFYYYWKDLVSVSMLTMYYMVARGSSEWVQALVQSLCKQLLCHTCMYSMYWWCTIWSHIWNVCYSWDVPTWSLPHSKLISCDVSAFLLED